MNTSREETVKATFGIGLATSIGTFIIKTPIGECELHIFRASTPFLFGLNVIYKRETLLENVRDKLIGYIRLSTPIICKFGHPFMM